MDYFIFNSCIAFMKDSTAEPSLTDNYSPIYVNLLENTNVIISFCPSIIMSFCFPSFVFLSKTLCLYVHHKIAQIATQFRPFCSPISPKLLFKRTCLSLSKTPRRSLEKGFCQHTFP